MINDGEYYFDENFIVKVTRICYDTLEIRRNLGIRYLHWENDRWGKDGGCKDYRTIEIEKKAIKFDKIIPQ